MKKVAYIASECVPFIKTGGLADVVGTLPRIFDKKEYDVRVIIPNYMCLPAKFKEKMRYLTHFHMDIGWKQQYVGVMYLEYEGVPVYFIDNEYYFNGFNIYSDDMKWDIEKFCYFSKAALSILPSIGFQPDIVCRQSILQWYEVNHDDPQPAVPGKMGYQDRTGVFRTARLSVHTG